MSIPANWLFGAILLLLLIQFIFGAYQWRQISAQNARLETIVNMFRVEQRAWLATSQTHLDKLKSGEKVTCAVTFKNTGHTIANVVSWGITVTDIDGDADISTVVDKERESNHSLPVANAVPPNGVFFITDTYSSEMSEALIKQINAGERKLMVVGNCYYRDVIENKLRTTQFCYFWAPSVGKLLPHNKGNSMD